MNHYEDEHHSPDVPEKRSPTEIIHAFLERTEHSANRVRSREAKDSTWEEIQAIESALTHRPNPGKALSKDEKRMLMRLCDPDLCNALPPIRFEVTEPAHTAPGRMQEFFRDALSHLLHRSPAASH